MKLKLSFAKHAYSKYGHIFLLLIVITLSCMALVLYNKMDVVNRQQGNLVQKNTSLEQQIASISATYNELKNQDQIVRNDKLEEEIRNIQIIYKKAVTAYEKLLDFKDVAKKTDDQDKLFSQSLTLLSQRNYASADAQLTTMITQIDKEQEKLAATFTIPANVPANNAPPGSGYSRQQVQSDVGNFLLDIISADLGSTHVIVDTASDNDCSNDCPVLSLADYVSRNGAFAGINGSYFCPAAYPSCAGKTNSFDLLVMNKNKHYFNSDNNVYSTNPAVIFGGGWIRFVGRALDWGRDTGVDGVLSNYPLLVSGGNIVYSDNPDPKFNSKGPRGFVSNKGNTVYIGFVSNATMGESAHVLKTLGMDNAMNLDEGGSTALWSGGYKLGPGRNIPNAILFVRK